MSTSPSASQSAKSANVGSGSLEQDGPLGMVAMKKEEQTGIVHDLGFGKGQCQTDKTSQTLSSCVIPALHMGRFSGLFAHSSVLLGRRSQQHTLSKNP